MEIGEEVVDDFEIIARVDEDVGFPSNSCRFSVLGCQYLISSEFEGAGDGGAQGGDRVVGCFGGADGMGGVGGDLEKFLVHVVVGEIGSADWKKSTKADVEG